MLLFVDNLNALPDQLCLLFLAFGRISGFIMMFPMSREWLPWSARLLIALALTVTAWPALQTTAGVQAMSASMVAYAVAEFLAGVLLGTVLAVFFAIFSLAGHMAGMQMALGLAELSDPMNGISVTVVSRLYQVAAQMVFIMVNGHLVVFVVLMDSFHTLPPGNIASLFAKAPELLGMVGWMFGAGLLMVLPLIFCLLVVNLAFGFMTRSAPQMNLLTLGFPLSILAGLMLLSLNIINLPSVLNRHLYDTLDMLRSFTG